MKKYCHIKEKAIPIYRGKLVIILTNDKKKLLKEVSSFPDVELYAHALLAKRKTNGGYIVVLNFDNANRKIYNGTIAHEAYHIVNYIAKTNGIDLDIDNDEALSYLIEWVTDEIYKFMKIKKLKAV